MSASRCAIVLSIFLGQLVHSGVTFVVVPSSLPDSRRAPSSLLRSRKVGMQQMILSPTVPRWGDVVPEPESQWNIIPKLPKFNELFDKASNAIRNQNNRAASVTTQSSHTSDFESSAELSSKLTLDYYFEQLRRCKRDGRLRFDEISPRSDAATLLRFATDNLLAGNFDSFSHPSVIYDGILSAMVTSDHTAKGSPAKRVHPLVEYGQLKPMPKHSKEGEQVSLTREVLEAYGVRTDQHMHFSLTKVLDSMGVTYTTDFTIHNGKIHMDLILSNNDKRMKGQKVVISAHDRECFKEGTNEVNAHLNLKKKSLGAMGYKVVTVPFFDWEKLKTSGQRVAYVAGKLSRAGFLGEGGGVFGESGTKVKSFMRSHVRSV